MKIIIKFHTWQVLRKSFLGKLPWDSMLSCCKSPLVETTFCEPNGRVFIFRQILQKIACISKVSEIGAGESAPGNPRKRPFLLSRLLSVRPSSGPYPPQKTCVRTKEMKSVMLPLIIVIAYTHYSCRFKGSTYPTGPIVLRTTLGSKSWSASPTSV